jgi:hypothetical protein
VSTSLVEESLHGRSVLEAFTTLYCMQRKDHRKEEHGGQASQPSTSNEDPVPSLAPLKFTASHRDEIRAAFWYCMHCICVGKDVLNLEPPPAAPEQCLICIEDLTYETTVRCGGKGNHKICKSCIERMITDAVRVKRQHRFNCFAGDATCRASYSRAQYEHIDPKTLKEIDRLEQEEQIRAAGFINLRSCPYCDFKMDYEPSPDINTFWCLADGCRKTSCLSCRGPDHQGETCVQNMWTGLKEKGGLDKCRTIMEEAMTHAVKRHCKQVFPFNREFSLLTLGLANAMIPLSVEMDAIR